MKLKNCILKVMDAKKPYNLSAEQNRYVDKMVREKMGFQMPRRAQKLPDFLNPAEIYVQIAKAHELSNEIGLLVEWQIGTGLRIFETSKQMIADIDFINNQIKVVRGKGGKDRYVPISNNLLQKIKLYLNGRTKGYLFCKSNGKPYTTRALQYKCQKAIEVCNFTKKLSTHSFRHTFACLCLAKGLPLETIKIIMGHSSIKTTEIYAKLELGSVKQKFLEVMT